jgi:hypothetical protein
MDALQAFASARLAQGLAQAEAAQAATVAALSKPQAKYLFFAAFYVCWQLLKLTLLRRVLPALARCLRRVPQLHVPLTADEADAAPKGAKWVRARPKLRPATAPAKAPVERRCGRSRGHTGRLARANSRGGPHRPSSRRQGLRCARGFHRLQLSARAEPRPLRTRRTRRRRCRRSMCRATTRARWSCSETARRTWTPPPRRVRRI